MAKTLLLVLVCFVCFSVMGCGKKEKEDAGAAKKTRPQAEDVGAKEIPKREGAAVPKTSGKTGEGTDAQEAIPSSTSLLHAIRSENVRAVRSLLDKGNNPNEKGDKDRTALHIAADKGNLAIGEALLSAGANCMVRDSNGSTPLHLAVQEKLTVNLTFSSDGPGKMTVTAPNKQERTDRQKLVMLLLDKGADVNAKTRGGYTPLKEAHNAAMSLLLIQKGADVNATDDEGDTVLHTFAFMFPFSAYGGDKAQLMAQLKVLLIHGAKVNAKNKKGDTPLDNAVFLWRKTKTMPDSKLNQMPHVALLRNHGARYSDELE